MAITKWRLFNSRSWNLVRFWFYKDSNRAYSNTKVLVLKLFWLNLLKHRTGHDKKHIGGLHFGCYNSTNGVPAECSNILSINSSLQFLEGKAAAKIWLGNQTYSYLKVTTIQKMEGKGFPGVASRKRKLRAFSAPLQKDMIGNLERVLFHPFNHVSFTN